MCYCFKGSTSYNIYSLPICKATVRLYAHKDKLLCSTYDNFDNDASITDNVHEMQLNLTSLMAHNNETDEVCVD